MAKTKVRKVEIDLDDASTDHTGVVVVRKDLGVELVIRDCRGVAMTNDKGDTNPPKTQEIMTADMAIDTENPVKYYDIQILTDTLFSGIELQYSRKGEIMLAHRAFKSGDKIKAAILSAGPTHKWDLRFKDGFVACGVAASGLALIG